MLNLFNKAGAALVFGAHLTALVGKETVSAEEATAANGELAEAGIKGAQLINEASFTDLTEKAGRVDAAEQAATDAKAAAKAATDAQEAATASNKATTDALAAAGVDSIAALVGQRDGYKVKADKFDKGPGANHTNPSLEAGKTDVEEGEPDAHQKAIDELPHNKALAGHPLFG